MATVNLIDSFWLEIVPIAVKVGNQDIAIGNAARFFRYAQEKHKQGKIVTEREFKENDFMEALIPIFATRTTDGIIAVGAEKHFGWLRKRIMAGSEGGKKSGEARRSDSNSLSPSKPKQTEANSSKPNPYSYSYSYSYSVAVADADADADSKNMKIEAMPKTEMHWLGILWNELSGPRLAKIKKTNAHAKNIGIRLKDEPSRKYWTEVVQKIAASDFLTGKTREPFYATFSWMLSKGKDGTLNHVKVMDGNYDNKEKSATVVSQTTDWLVEANLIFQACKKHGFSDSAIRPFVGDASADLLRKAGGAHALGQMPDNEFTIKALASKLKAASNPGG